MVAAQIHLLIFLLSVTLPVHGDELRFLVVGDWGGIPWWPYTTPYETAVSRGMGKIAEQLGTQFTVALGRKEFYNNNCTVYKLAIRNKKFLMKNTRIYSIN